MRVLISGATGFIGRALVPRLQRDGHSIVVWARSEMPALSLLGADVDVVTVAAGQEALVAALSASDAVVNLAGEPLLGKRWTPERRAALRASRVDVTEQVVNAIELAPTKPRVLVSASAVGFYGDRGDERLSESSAPRDDFLSGLCQAWEHAAERASTCGVRVALMRTGVVLGRGGGALLQMLPPFRAGAGGPIGSGRQYLPWIHLHDLVDLIATAIADDRYRGPINAVSPEAVTSTEFARALGRALHRPAVLPTPSFALRAIFGEAAVVLLASQRVSPVAAQQFGFVWKFPSLDTALRDIVVGPPVAIGRAISSSAAAPSAKYELQMTTSIHAPLDDVFAFFSSAANLGLITPAAMRLRIEGAIPTLAEGVTINYRVRVGPLPLRWRSRIVAWNPPTSFVDTQERGPYRVWRHEHRFRVQDATTVMEDRIYYTPRLTFLSSLANVFVSRKLREIFRYRADIIRLRFG